MPFFKKQRTAQQIGNEAAIAVQQVRQGIITRDEYHKIMASLVADFLAAAKGLRFKLDDVDTIVACGEKLGEDDQLRYFEVFRHLIDSLKEDGPVITFALQRSAYQVYQLAATRASSLNKEQRWEESLHFCQMAERALPQFESLSTIEAPQLYAVSGRALQGLKRYTEAYKTFKRAISLAQQVLSGPNGNIQSEERDHLLFIVSHCQEMLADLESEMK